MNSDDFKTKPGDKKPDKDFTFLKTNNGVEQKFFWDEFLYLKAQGDYTLIVTTKCEILKTAKLSAVLKKIAHPYLFRCHRSYAVNPNRIEKKRYGFIIINSVEIPVARQYKELLFEIIG